MSEPDLIHPDQLTFTDAAEAAARIGRSGITVSDASAALTDAVGKYRRRGQSATSRVAAVEAVPLTGSKRAELYEYIKRRGIHGATDEEAQRWLGMNPSTQRPRRVELVDAGLIRDSGATRKTRSGRPAVVWVVA